MRIDKKLLHLLSDFFLDIAKAFFIASFVTPSLSGVSSFLEISVILTRGVVSATLFIYMSWVLAKMEEEQDE